MKIIKQNCKTEKKISSNMDDKGPFRALKIGSKVFSQKIYI